MMASPHNEEAPCPKRRKRPRSTHLVLPIQPPINLQWWFLLLTRKLLILRGGSDPAPIKATAVVPWKIINRAELTPFSAARGEAHSLHWWHLQEQAVQHESIIAIREYQAKGSMQEEGWPHKQGWIFLKFENTPWFCTYFVVYFLLTVLCMCALTGSIQRPSTIFRVWWFFFVLTYLNSPACNPVLTLPFPVSMPLLYDSTHFFLSYSLTIVVTILPAWMELPWRSIGPMTLRPCLEANVGTGCKWSFP